MLVRLTQVDYDRHIAMVALRNENASEKMVGVARIIRGPAEQQAEFSVAVGDRWQGKGIGRTLVERALAAARDYGIRRVQGNVLSDNKGMLGLGRKLGFEIKWDADAGDFISSFWLGSPLPPWPSLPFQDRLYSNVESVRGRLPVHRQVVYPLEC